MNSLRLRILYCLLPSLLYGCAGGNGTLVRSEAQSQATTQLERGIRAQNKGENTQAEKYLSDSLKISSSIEDNPAKVAALINLARINRLNNKLESALSYIDSALTLTGGIPPQLSAEAAYEKALTEMAQKHFAEALTWADKSLSSDSADLKGRLLNLLVRIHRSAGKLTEARAFAVKAREENRRSGDLAEESNAVRLLGSLERENKKFDEAGKLLLESLDIDKKIGDSQKIAFDLEELAALFGDKGETDMMVDYLERAFSVHIGGARLQKGASIQLKIAEIHRKTGKNELAEKSLQNAEKLKLKEEDKK